VSSHSRLGFPGQYFDTEDGLHQNWFRDYDSSLGRYIENDPIGLDGGINTFSYVGNRPTLFSDPQGKNPLVLALPFIPELFGIGDFALFGGGGLVGAGLGSLLPQPPGMLCDTEQGCSLLPPPADTAPTAI
jgi:RHS repeat-associated protein